MYWIDFYCLFPWKNSNNLMEQYKNKEVTSF